METPTKTFKSPFTIEDINFPIFGVKKEDLSPKDLKSLLEGRKTSALVVAYKKDNEIQESIARISLKKEDGSQYAKAWCDFKNEKEFKIADKIAGVEITAEDKKALMDGKALWKEGFVNEKTGETYDSWLIKDKSLNKIAHVSEKYMKVPTMLKGVNLSEEQQEKWRNGEKIFLSGLSKTDKPEQKFSAYITNSPITGQVDFEFPKSIKNGTAIQEKVDIKTPEIKPADLTTKPEVIVKSEKTETIKANKNVKAPKNDKGQDKEETKSKRTVKL